MLIVINDIDGVGVGTRSTHAIHIHVIIGLDHPTSLQGVVGVGGVVGKDGHRLQCGIVRHQYAIHIDSVVGCSSCKGHLHAGVHHLNGGGGGKDVLSVLIHCRHIVTINAVDGGGATHAVDAGLLIQLREVLIHQRLDAVGGPVGGTGGNHAGHPRGAVVIEVVGGIVLHHSLVQCVEHHKCHVVTGQLCASCQLHVAEQLQLCRLGHGGEIPCATCHIGIAVVQVTQCHANHLGGLGSGYHTVGTEGVIAVAVDDALALAHGDIALCPVAVGVGEVSGQSAGVHIGTV